MSLIRQEAVLQQNTIGGAYNKSQSSLSTRVTPTIAVTIIVISRGRIRAWDHPTVAVVILSVITQSAFVLASTILTSILTTKVLRATMMENGRAMDNIKATPLREMEL